MKLSFIAVGTNRLDYLKCLLWNIFYYQDLDQSLFEVIVVNDGGMDILEYLKNNYSDKNLKYIYLNHKLRRGIPNTNTSRAIPVNRGISCAEGEIIVISDWEMYLLESNHLSTFYNSIGSKQIMSAMPIHTRKEIDLRFYMENYKNPILFEDYLKKHYTSNADLWCFPTNVPDTVPEKIDPYGQKYATIDGTIHWLYRCSGYWAQLRKDFISIGGCEERAWGLAGDDCELSYRLDYAGFSYIPSHLHMVHNYHGRGEDARGTGNGSDTPDLHDPRYIKYEELKNEFPKEKLWKMFDNRLPPKEVSWNSKLYMNGTKEDDIFIDFQTQKI